MKDKAEQTETQCDIILRYLQAGRKLTNIKMLQIAGSLAGSQRIANLRDRGHDIKTEMIRTKSGKRIAQYSLNLD